MTNILEPTEHTEKHRKIKEDYNKKLLCPSVCSVGYFFLVPASPGCAFTFYFLDIDFILKI